MCSKSRVKWALQINKEIISRQLATPTIATIQAMIYKSPQLSAWLRQLGMVQFCFQVKCELHTPTEHIVVPIKGRKPEAVISSSNNEVLFDDDLGALLNSDSWKKAEFVAGIASY